MPTYEYECTACGGTFEKFQPITAKRIRKCPRCGKRRVRRLIGAGAGIIFKGSGFYQTDYRSNKGRPKKESGEEGASAPNPEERKAGSGGKKDESNRGRPKKESGEKGADASNPEERKAGSGGKKDE